MAVALLEHLAVSHGQAGWYADPDLFTDAEHEDDLAIVRFRHELGCFEVVLLLMAHHDKSISLCKRKLTLYAKTGVIAKDSLR